MFNNLVYGAFEMFILFKEVFNTSTAFKAL